MSAVKRPLAWTAAFLAVFLTAAIINGLAPEAGLGFVIAAFAVAIRARRRPLPRLGLGTRGTANAALFAAALALLGVLATFALRDAAISHAAPTPAAIEAAG